MIANRGSPSTIHHPIRCSIVSSEHLVVQPKGHARDAKLFETLGRRLDIDAGGLGQINNYVVFQQTNQRGAITLVELQACFSAATGKKELPMSLKEQRQ
jgi:hypothetical protein